MNDPAFAGTLAADAVNDAICTTVTFEQKDAKKVPTLSTTA
jgi:hypothetical protein